MWTRPGQDCQTWRSSIEPFWWNHPVQHSGAAPTIEIRAALKKDKLSVRELAAEPTGLSCQPGDPPGSAWADRPWRSDAGNGEAAARARRIGRMIEVLHCCSIPGGVISFIPVAVYCRRVLHFCSIPKAVDLVARAAIWIVAAERLDARSPRLTILARARPQPRRRSGRALLNDAKTNRRTPG